MNKYYYVSVMNENVTCNGVSFPKILKTADSQLYRECFTEKDKSKLVASFKKRQLPHKIVIVDNGGRSYELATEVNVDFVSMDSIVQCEVSGMDVVDIFVENQNYSDSVFNMMEKYYKNNSDGTKKVIIKK